VTSLAITIGIGFGTVLLGLGSGQAQTAALDPAAAVVEVKGTHEGIAGAAKSAVDQVFGAGQGADRLGLPDHSSADDLPGAPADADADRGRDPFRPFTLDLRPETHESEIVTPLQRYELPQLRLAGVVLDLATPRAMLQDNSGMGFIVTPGTPIGRRRGVVKSIEPRRVIVEETILDYYGREQVHQVVIEMPKEEKQTQIANQEY
jgi:type IV pilus assembly protein PilP